MLVALAIALMLVTVSACSSQRPPSGHEDSAGVATTAGRPSLCSSATSRDLVARFLRADRADAKAVVELFIAPEPAFEWFSTRDRIQPEAMNRSSLSSYLAEREERNVHQSLEEFTFNGVDGGHGNFAFVIRESTLTESVRYPGKGAVDCTSGKLIVWSEGSPDAGEPAAPS